MTRPHLLRTSVGIVVSVLIIAGLFYLFLFPNPLGLHQVTLLRWIPILAGFAGLLASGFINRNTPAKFLPALFLPFVIFDLFNYLYFPFLVVLLVVGVLAIVLTRPDLERRVKSGAGLAVTGIFVYFLLAQPLILEHEDFGRNELGHLVGASVLWDFTAKTPQTLPHHILVDPEGAEYDTADLKGKTHFVSLWATWCGPCIEKKPQLEQLKRDYRDNAAVGFVDLSIDEDREQWASFVAEHSPGGIQLIARDADETRRRLGINALPLYFVVDTDGAYTSFMSQENAERMLRSTVGP